MSKNKNDLRWFIGFFPKACVDHIGPENSDFCREETGVYFFFIASSLAFGTLRGKFSLVEP